MQQTTTQLKEVNGRTATVRGQVTNVYDAICADGRKYTIWEAQLAQLAHTLIGQNVLLTYTEKPSSNPAYPPNFTLKGIQATTAPAAGVPVAQTQPVPAQNGGAAPTTINPQNPPVVQFTTTEDKSDRIERQSAYKAAVDHVGRIGMVFRDEDEAWRIVQKRTEQLAYYAKHGRWMDTELPVPVAAEGDEDWA